MSSPNPLEMRVGSLYRFLGRSNIRYRRNDNPQIGIYASGSDANFKILAVLRKDEIFVYLGSDFSSTFNILTLAGTRGRVYLYDACEVEEVTALP